MDITQNQVRGLIVGGFLVAGTALMAPALLSSCSPGQHRAGLSVVSPAKPVDGRWIVCDGRVILAACRTLPPGVTPSPSWPGIPYRPLPTDSSGALVLQDAP